MSRGRPGHATPHPPSGGAGPLPLRGREDELALIGRDLEALGGGHGGVILIEGAPGSGKTSVLEEIERRAAGTGIRTFRAACDAAAGAMPLSPLLDALLHGRPPLLDARVLREIAAMPDARFWMLQELQERLERAALAAPLVVAVDDLHWADEATLLALRTLPERLATHALLWVLARRPGGAALTAGRLQESGARSLVLGALER
ncbi:MAG TPA: ATP-binding protein, partial [Solirubrobacteraceae bacterium]